MKTPWLKKIDLRKITKKDDHINHPDIKLNCQYLVKYGRDWLAGYFVREWHGLVFFSDVSFDLDDLDIKGIWQIICRR